MNNFTDFSKIVESRKNYDSGSLLASEVQQYLNKVNKVLPKNVQDAIYLTKKYKLMDANSIDEIRNASKSELKQLSIKYNIGIDSLENLWKLLKELKNKIKLLPQFMSAQERDALELGKLSMDDITIDLSTPQGRNAATKMYMPLVYKIVSQYMGKSDMTRQELISSALLGFTGAMNDWERSDDPEVRRVSFKTYAGYRAKQQILNDMNSLTSVVSGANGYNREKYGNEIFNAISIDGYVGSDDEKSQDRWAELGTKDADYELRGDESKQWNDLYKLLDNKFSSRDVDIFYRYFGLNGRKREKSKDIAKSMGMSEGNIRNSIINKIILFLKKDRKASDILSGIQTLYNESLMIELVNLSKDQILETLAGDDMFILLEELNKWNNIDIFKSALLNAIGRVGSDSKIILKMLGEDFEYIDSNFKKYKKLIIYFLSFLYPTENLSRKSDVALLEYMEEIQQYYKKYKFNL